MASSTVFKFHQRKAPPDQLVIHENAGYGFIAQTTKTLKGNGYGTHYIIDWNGLTAEVADPRNHVVTHASGFNERAVGFDYTNPVQAPKGAFPKKFLAAGEPHIIEGGTQFWRARYVVPSLAICESALTLITSLINNPALNIPNVIPSFNGASIVTGNISKTLYATPGIFAHGQISGHHDGYFVLLFFALMRSGIRSTAEAYQELILLLEAKGRRGNTLQLPADANTNDIPLERRRLNLVAATTRRGYQGKEDKNVANRQAVEAARQIIGAGTFEVESTNTSGLLFNYATGLWSDEE